MFYMDSFDFNLIMAVLSFVLEFYAAQNIEKPVSVTCKTSADCPGAHQHYFCLNWNCASCGIVCLCSNQGHNSSLCREECPQFVQPEHSPKEHPHVDDQEKDDTKGVTNYASSSDKNNNVESSPLSLASIFIAVLVFIIIGLIIAFGLLWYNKQRKLKVLQDKVDEHRQNQELQYQDAYHTGRNHGNKRVEETAFDLGGKFDDDTDKDAFAQNSSASYQIEQHVPRAQMSTSQKGTTRPKHRNRTSNEEVESLEREHLVPPVTAHRNKEEDCDSRFANWRQPSLQRIDETGNTIRSSNDMDINSPKSHNGCVKTPVQVEDRPHTQPSSLGHSDHKPFIPSPVDTCYKSNSTQHNTHATDSSNDGSHSELRQKGTLQYAGDDNSDVTRPKVVV